MGLQDILGYCYIPVSGTVSVAQQFGSAALNYLGLGGKGNSSQIKFPAEILKLDVSKLVQQGNPYIRIAAISGSTALILGAYGAHRIPMKEGFEERKCIFEIANKYHFYYTLGLMGVPMCQNPKTVCFIMTVGAVIFSGSCYYRALTGNPALSKLTPLGGFCLIIGWLGMFM